MICILKNVTNTEDKIKNRFGEVRRPYNRRWRHRDPEASDSDIHYSEISAARLQILKLARTLEFGYYIIAAGDIRYPETSADRFKCYL
ncbi:hypothetical protein V490_01475 [Pseudogymnoascus sp. VKM F-3557]|nr:hypothetical protein V490_01475 [Pseudogymnoascus sp. VKM F-3557]